MFHFSSNKWYTFSKPQVCGPLIPLKRSSVEAIVIHMFCSFKIMFSTMHLSILKSTEFGIIFCNITLRGQHNVEQQHKVFALVFSSGKNF